MEKISSLIPDSLKKITQPAPGSTRCPIHGLAVLEELVSFGNRQVSICGKCPECEGERRQAGGVQEDEKEAAKLAARRRMGVPERFLSASLDDFRTDTDDQKLVAKAVREFVDGGWRRSAGFLFTGKCGTAKTLLGAALVNHWIDHYGNRSARFETMLGLMRKIKATWDPESFETEAMLLRRLREVSLLIVDEIGVQFGSNTEAALFTDLINDRYNAMQPTVLITNLSVADCYKILGDRVMDRMKDGGRALAFSWESWRGKQRD